MKWRLTRHISWLLLLLIVSIRKLNLAIVSVVCRWWRQINLLIAQRWILAWWWLIGAHHIVWTLIATWHISTRSAWLIWTLRVSFVIQQVNIWQIIWSNKLIEFVRVWAFHVSCVYFWLLIGFVLCQGSLFAMTIDNRIVCAVIAWMVISFYCWIVNICF